MVYLFQDLKIKQLMETGMDTTSRQSCSIWHGIQLKILSPVLRLTACTCIMPEIVAEVVLTYPDSFWRLFLEKALMLFRQQTGNHHGCP